MTKNESAHPILDAIAGPGDLKSLTLSELESLRDEIRNRIISVLSTTGGHLASNLGIIELTIGMHKVFNSPHDKIIFDVSHQSYVHKLLTGRNDQFHTIRQSKGLSGFSHPKESPHDHFFAGHAGTALSLALGVAKRRDLLNSDEYVLPVIGDATLTCGVSLEALNNISRDLKKFIVILNDNEMSISKNVGAITQILSRMVNNTTTNWLSQELDALIKRVPGYGSKLSHQGQKITESIKNLFSPAAFFEHFGLSYIGPIDGHDIKQVIDALEGVKNSTWPVILHFLTQKGKGMDEAIKNPVTWHGAKPFCMNTQKFLPTASNNPSFPKIFGRHILEMANEDDSIVTVTPAMSCGSCLDPFVQKYPERCLDVGIAESHSVTFCGGLAHGGKLKVVSSIYSTFLQRAFDNLFHDVCLQELRVVFAVDRAGIAGGDGQTHNGIYDISFLNAMPNMVIAQPRDGDLLKDLLESAFSWNRPVAIRYPNIETSETDRPRQKRVLGRGEILSSGKEIVLIGLGHMAITALAVKEALKEYGVDATVVDPIFVKPLDTDLLTDLLLTHSVIVTIEEHSAMTGLGSIINHHLMTNGFTGVQSYNYGVPETFIEQGKLGDLLDEIGLSKGKIVSSLVKKLGLVKNEREQSRLSPTERV